MDDWTPDISGAPGPKYKAIANAILGDIRRGELQPGERLPTHRDLAYRLGVTVGTVTRAYSEAEQRGLVAGEVGRGTYVRDPSAPINSALLDSSFILSIPETKPDAGSICDLSLSLPVSNVSEKHLAQALAAISQSPRIGELLDYAPEAGIPSHKLAIAAWIKRFSGMEVAPERIIITNGAQHAVFSAAMSICSRGDVVLTEALTYHGIKTLADELGLNMEGLEMDSEGITPEAFEEACISKAPKALYTIPTLQNPTSRTMSTERRKQIAAIARKYSVVVLEDDIFGPLADERPLPISYFAPEISYYITSFSKCVAPGMRCGCVVAPKHMTKRVASAVRDTSRMATPLMTEIITQWIENGTVEEITNAQKNEMSRRQQVALNALSGLDIETCPGAFNILLYPPDHWGAEELVAAARERGVMLVPASAFSVGKAGKSEKFRNAVRICVGACRDEKLIAEGLKKLSALVAENPPAIPGKAGESYI